MSKKAPPETPLYVKIPTSAVDKLGRAAEALGVAKKDLVAGLVTKYVDPDTTRGLDALSSLGRYSFQPYDPPELPEVLNVEQAAQFLQVEEAVIVEMAETGQLPGRKLGPAWRFSKAALVAWLAQPQGKESKR